MISKKANDYKCSLSAADIEKAKKELNETPDTRLIEVNTLRNRLENVPGLVLRKDTPFLLQFLRARKFDQEKAFQLVKNYYAIRREYPEVFSDMKPSRARSVFDNGLFEILKDRNKEGCRVIVFRTESWDPDRQSLAMIFLAVHLLMCTLLEDCLPLRFKRIDYIHEPSVFDVVFAIFKPFLSEKLSSRIFMNGDKFENIHKIMNPDHLPTDFGGRLPLHSNKAWMDAFLASDVKFEEDNKFGFVNMAVNKDKKATKREDADLAGLGGTFKKLDI